MNYDNRNFANNNNTFGSSGGYGSNQYPTSGGSNANLNYQNPQQGRRKCSLFDYNYQ